MTTRKQQSIFEIEETIREFLITMANTPGDHQGVLDAYMEEIKAMISRIWASRYQEGYYANPCTEKDPLPHV